MEGQKVHVNRETREANMACQGNGCGKDATVRITLRSNEREDWEEAEPLPILSEKTISDKECGYA